MVATLLLSRQTLNGAIQEIIVTVTWSITYSTDWRRAVVRGMVTMWALKVCFAAWRATTQLAPDLVNATAAK